MFFVPTKKTKNMTGMYRRRFFLRPDWYNFPKCLKPNRNAEKNASDFHKNRNYSLLTITCAWQVFNFQNYLQISSSQEHWIFLAGFLMVLEFSFQPAIYTNLFSLVYLSFLSDGRWHRFLILVLLRARCITMDVYFVIRRLFLIFAVLDFIKLGFL